MMQVYDKPSCLVAEQDHSYHGASRCV